MATIEQFNAGIDEMRRDYPIAIIAMYDDGQRTIFPLQRGKGIDSFQATVKSGHYEHVALKFGGRIMAIWHRDSKAAAPAQPAGDFGVGDKVVIRKDAKLREGSYLALLQKARSVGEVVDFDRERVIVEFDGAAADDGNSLLPEQLTLWTPAEPGSDAKDEYTRDEEQARLIARIRELEEALEQIKETAEYRLEDWIAVQVQYLPGHMVGYRLILNKANEALADAQEERG